MIVASSCSRRALFGLVFLLVASCKPASPPAAAISVTNAWARETAPGQTGGAVYLTIANTSAGDDRLLSVTSPRAANAMLHASSSEGGMIGMRMMRALDIRAGQTVTLAPLGSHIMLTGVATPLKPGERVPLMLRFAHAGARQVDAAVLPAGATGPGN